jgi:NIMA-interacting peptidyl-prolyl cis-trans isomerase 4
LQGDLIVCVNQCEKHSKKEEALTKLREGAKFDDVAREYSEDKARQGMVEVVIRRSHLSAMHWISSPPNPSVRSANVDNTSYHTGGSLGWKTRGSLHGDFEKVAYELEPSTTGNPKCE